MKNWFIFLTLFLCALITYKILDHKPPAWMTQQIQSDLSLIGSEGVTKERLDKTMENEFLEKGRNFLLRVQVEQGKTQFTYHPSRAKDFRTCIMIKIFERLAKQYPLPNLDFIVSLHDSIDKEDLPAPIFAFAKDSTHSKKIILIPDFETFDCGKGLIREMKHASKAHPWKTKKNQAIWRGATSGGIVTFANFSTFPRSQLVATSLKHPDLIDARLILRDQCIPPQEILDNCKDYFGGFLSISDHMPYKYQILIDGNSCAYARAYWQLFSNSVIFKQNSPNIQWYYGALKPYTHYIPVQSNFADLPEKIEWAKAHDLEAKRIQNTAQRFARNNLIAPKMSLYLYLLLREYAKYQKF